jgi:hypothetical protein
MGGCGIRSVLEKERKYNPVSTYWLDNSVNCNERRQHC